MGVAVDTVQANGMEWLLEYGKYCLAKEIVSALILSVIVGLIFSLASFLAEVGELKLKKHAMSGLFGFVLATSFVIFVKVIPFLMSPMMYSIEQAMKLLN